MKRRQEASSQEAPRESPLEERPGGTRRQEGTSRRQEIVAAAGEMFRERGYHATSMRDLAGRLELRGSSLYAHIEGKEALLAEIVHRAADAFLAAAETADPGADPGAAPAAGATAGPGADPTADATGAPGAPAPRPGRRPGDGAPTGAERLLALCRGHLRVVLERLPDAVVFLHEWRFLPEAERERVVERRDAYQAAFRAAIEAGVRDGSLETDDPALATLFTLSALNGTASWLRPDGPLGADALIERYAALAVRGLEPSRPRPR